MPMAGAHNASHKRRPDRGVRWRPKAGANLMALLERTLQKPKILNRFHKARHHDRHPFLCWGSF
jgi:hypothetical protein